MRMLWVVLWLVCGSVQASTVDISDMAGFSYDRFYAVWESPVYSVTVGDTVDFGTAVYAPVYCYSGPPCVIGAKWYTMNVVYLSDGLAIDGTNYWTTLYLYNAIDNGGALRGCLTNPCIPTQYFPLVFTVPGDQIAFEFSAFYQQLSIIPPVPLPSSWVLFLVGLSTLLLFCRRSFMLG